MNKFPAILFSLREKNMAIGVMTVYAALAVWAGLLVHGIMRKSYRLFLYFGLGLMLYLNLGYVIWGIPASIASFIGIYDVLINIGVVSATDHAAISTCPENSCTVWGERFVNHPAWGTAFYDRFANGSEFRSLLLYGHIVFNSLAFVLLHVQLFRPGFAEHKSSHRLLGKITFGILTISLVCAVWLASQHGSVAEYGGRLAEFGFYSMAAFVYGTAIMGIVAIRSGDAEAHRVWMFRFAGSMWGSFWLFRVMLFVLDPLLRNVESAAILICIWSSAPLGIVLGELVRRRLDRPQTLETSTNISPA
ncbi:MAG: DUF2306 domain-containing protein [Rhizobiaceae bacterium]